MNKSIFLDINLSTYMSSSYFLYLNKYFLSFLQIFFTIPLIFITNFSIVKEYPRSLSAAMSLNDVDAVFDLQDTLVKGEHEFWTLGSPDGTCQIRTDDYAFVNRFWLNHLNISQDISKGTTTTVSMNVKQLLDQSLQSPVKSAYDRIIVRIYRLWKDVRFENFLLCSDFCSVGYFFHDAT